MSKLTTEQIIKGLENLAKWDSIASEFGKERHIAWIAAQRLKELDQNVKAYHDICMEYYPK